MSGAPAVSLTDKHIGRILSNPEALKHFPGLKPYITTVRRVSSCCGGGMSYKSTGSAGKVIRSLLSKGDAETTRRLKKAMGIAPTGKVKFYSQDRSGLLTRKVV